MQVVWLAPYPPDPPWHGGRIRLRHLVEGMVAFGHEVRVMCPGGERAPRQSVSGLTVEPLQGRRRTTILERLSAGGSTLPEAAWLAIGRGDRARVDEALRHADVVIMEQVHMVAYARLVRRRGLPLVLDTQNIEHELLLKMSRAAVRRRTRARLSADAVKMRHYERKLLRNSARVTAVSEADRDAILRLEGSTQVDLVPNGVDPNFFAPVDHRKARGANFVMTGTMGYPPNLDAAMWLIDDIFPRIRRMSSNATLTLVGNGPTDELCAAARSAKVIITGSVPDVRPYLRDADVFVMPLRMGSGTRLKALEAMASGIPLVSTSVGCEGLDVRNDSHVLIADDADAFARSCVSVLNDEGKRHSITTAARELVEERYDWGSIARSLHECVNRAVLAPGTMVH